MKKSLTLMCALLLSAGLTVKANPITRSEARQVAQELVGIDDDTPDNVAVAPFYVFSRGAGRGFVIVSGDDSTAPILGYTEQGDFAADQLPPQLQGMLGLWKERIREVQRHPQTGVKRISAPRRAVADFKKGWTNVEPLVKTHWHQDYPYNILAPLKNGSRCMTGCVATAGSQVTYYFHKDTPSELAYNTPTYSYGTPITVSLPKGTPIEWEQMKLSGRGTARQDSAVAKLMYALGTSAWLTYGDGDGLATSGHNEKMAEAMKGQFRLNYEHKYKGGETQQQWEELIYENLASLRPMLYSGVHPDNGGHSVVLDGYKASTGLFHFNFGWGGQGDGYYTVDDQTGMNGFNSYQDLVYNITPQVQNLSAEVVTTNLYHKATTDIEVTVTNNGTLSYQGVYIYINKRGTVTGTAVANDQNTVIEPGQSVTLSFPVTTTQKDSAFVLLCDKSRHLLASQKVTITSTVADMHLTGICVDGSAETTTVDDIAFQHVNNSSATVTATLTNGADGTFCQPNMQCFLEQYVESTKTWKSVKNIIQNTYSFERGQTVPVDFVFTGLTTGNLYRAYMNDKAVASSQSDITVELDTPYVCFTIRDADLEVVADGRTATVTGHWNAALFREKATDARVCSYDITQLKELNAKPEAANPNALFFTDADDTAGSASVSLASAGIENVVVGDVCQRLVLQTDADFLPLRPFTAREASMQLTEAEPGKWLGTLVPFAFDVPYGMQMKVPTEYVAKSSATIKHEAARTVEAMTMVTYLTSRTGLDTVTASNVAIGTDTVATMFDDVLRAYTVSTPIEENALVQGQYISLLYFIAPAADQTTLQAFHPEVTGATAKRVATTSEILVDGYYRSLSITIDKAYATMTENPGPAAALKALLDELAVAEELFTNRSHEEATDIKNENATLEDAIKAYLEALENAAIEGDVNGDGAVDVADIATIISVMAWGSGTDTELAWTADVNADGTVDVADIATVISIMAK